MAVDVGRTGVWSPQGLWQGPEAGEAAAELEELGYTALWIGGSPPGDLVLPERLLAATDRIALATGIVNIWTEPSELIAASYHRVATAYPGRFLLGLGTSHAPAVEARTGQRYVRPYQRLVRYLDELDAASPPVPAVGRVLAALGPKTLALAATRAAGAHPYLVTPEHTRLAREVLGAGPLLAPEQKVVLDTNPESARALARKTVEFYLGLPNYTNKEMTQNLVTSS